MVLQPGKFQNLLAGACLAIVFREPAAAVDVLTIHNDIARTGQNLGEGILTPANVNPTNFGRLFTLTVDGKVDAEPLYVSGQIMGDGQPHNLLIVATENDSVYAFDADSGAALWQVSLLLSGETPSDDRGCSQVEPTIGVTGTPVIDLSSGPNGTIYAVAMSKNSSSTYFQRLHALNLKTGADQFGGPVVIQGTYPGTGEDNSGGNVFFDPKQYKARPGLLVVSGVVYIGWSSHCDDQPYTAWLMGYDESSLAQVTLLNFTPNGQEGSIWQAGAGPAADTQGNIYFLMANGTFDTTLTPAGFPSHGDYGNGFMKVAPFPAGLSVTDYFTMENTVSESNGDVDLGSGGALVLPDMVDANGVTRHLAVGAGKDANIYLVDRDNMGKFSPTADLNYQLPAVLGGGVWSSPAYFNGSLYYGASGDTIRAYAFSQARLSSSPTSHSAQTFAYPGATPSISANGSSNGIVWVAENTSPAVLHAYNAANLAVELYNTNMASGSRDHFGSGNKYITPTVVNGKVYVGTTNGVGVFGILPGGAAPAVTSSLTASAVVGTSFRYQITATNGPTSFGTSTLPAGLAFNSASGVIAGVPSAAGTSNVTISATNIHGSGSATLSIAVSNACSFTLSPANNSFLNIGGTGSVSVIAPGGCGWTAATNSSWLTITSGSSGSGNGTVNFSIAANTESGRSGMLTIGEQTFTVNQSGREALQFYPVPPCRLVDTRGPAAGFNGIAPFSGPSIPAGGTVTIPVQSASEASANTAPAPCGVIPSTAQAYSLNLTVVPHAAGAVNYVSLWPAGSTRPFVSTLNDLEGLIVANAAIVPAGTPSGGISVYNSGPSAADVIIDMNGYFAAPATGLQFYPVAPCRLVDTRGGSAGFNGIDPFAGPSLTPGETLTIPVQSTTEAGDNTAPAPCGVIPSGAEAYSFNLTVVPRAGGPVDYVTLWPAGAARPFVSTLNDTEGAIVANAAIVPAGSSSGGVSVYNSGPSTADVVIDMNGYFAAPTVLQFYPMAPCRLVDTRGVSAGFNGIEPFSGPSIPAAGTLTIPVQSAAEASANTQPAPCG